METARGSEGHMLGREADNENMEGSADQGFGRVAGRKKDGIRTGWRFEGTKYRQEGQM